MYDEGRELAIQGRFTFVALDDDKRPIPVLAGLDIDRE
jgi:acyl-CoA hydrolase